MPRNTREWALRELDAAVNNIDWSDKHILKVVNRYLDVHPEIAKPLHDMLSLSDILKTSIKLVRSSI